MNLSQMDIATIYFVIGALIVAGFSINYFNNPGYRFVEEDSSNLDDIASLAPEPALPKFLTDRFEYNLYLLAYLLVAELIFLLLVLFLPDLMSKDAPPLTFLRENIVLACLIITGIAPNLPFVRRFLERTKIYLHNKAQIPAKGRNIYRQLKSYIPHYRSDEINAILKDARYTRRKPNGENSRDELASEDFLANRETLQARWAKLTYLMFFVKRWGENPTFRNHINHRELRRSTLEKAYDNLLPQMTHLRQGKLSQEEITKLRSKLDLALHRTYRLISCLLYLAVKSDQAVDQFLVDLGYPTEERNDFPMPWRNLAFVLFAVAGSIFVGGMLALFLKKTLNLALTIQIGTIFKWIVFGVPFMTIPTLLVLFTKRLISNNSNAWPFITIEQRYEKLGDRPWHIYTLITLLAYLSGAASLFLTAMFFAWLKQGSLQDFNFSGMSNVTLAWAGLVLVISAFTCFRLDSVPKPGQSRIRYVISQSFGALLQGTATSFAAWVAFMHTFNNGNITFANMPQPQQDKLALYCLISFCIGTAMYFAADFNAAQQRRRAGRRRICRPVQIEADTGLLQGILVNVSRDGALIEAKLLNGMPFDMNDLRLVSTNGIRASARVVDRRRNLLNLNFTDRDQWGSLLQDLGVPLTA